MAKKVSSSPTIRHTLSALSIAAFVACVVSLTACGGKPAPAFTPDATPGPAIVDGQIVSDFPRILSTVPWGQPIEDIARFNAVNGGWAYPGAIDEVKAANPAILVFEATNACELGFDPTKPVNAATVQSLSMPPEWFLTQVGSELAAPVDATTTTFEVEATTILDGDEAIELFVVGEALLVDTESVLVTAVDHDNRLLTVERGYVRPASAHPAGTRIAAHVMIWPNLWVMNLSTLSPKAIGPDSTSPETFAEYNARVGIDLVHGSNVDGIFIDRTDPGVSALLWYDTVRTIDPDQSNTLLTDTTELDESWNEGIRVYERLLREGIGDDKIIYVNRGMANLDLLNGYHAEDFPKVDGTTYAGVAWTEVMFGTSGYFTWLEGAQEPRFTVIQTYQDARVPSSTGGSTEIGALQQDADCADPGYEPDYRMMRFGLTTTLLGDGYFDFEWSTYAQSWKCLFWFDEYDNAGKGTGYLGQPLGDAFQPLAQNATPNLILEETFEDGSSNWASWANGDEGYGITQTLDDDAASGDASLQVTTTGDGGVSWQANTLVGTFPVEEDAPLRFSFWAKADQSRSIQAVLQTTEGPYRENIPWNRVDLSAQWRHYELAGETTFGDPAATLAFRLGDSPGTVWLDDVSIQVDSDQVWRRDFEGGIALVNASSETQTIPLDGRFQKIEGTQDPEVNDGSFVTSVTLPPLDGIILIRLAD